MKQTVIGIDVGGSTTKIVGFRYSDSKNPQLIKPLFVRATDPVTAMYGAFGRFTSENGIALDDIDCVMTTGVGSSFLQQPIYNLPCHTVPEFSSIGRGGLYLSGLSDAIVVSMGTGTAIVHAKAAVNEAGIPLVGGEYDTEIAYLGGTGVGGGTMLGLTKLLTGVGTIEHIEQLCQSGNLANIDLRVGDISKKTFQEMSDNLTASNFGKVSDLATHSDLALGIANLVAETIAMMSIFAARSFGIHDIVLIGNLSSISPVRRVFEELGSSFDVNFVIPENSQFGTVIGAALHRA
jgi:type II pantothenate kinase